MIIASIIFQISLHLLFSRIASPFSRESISTLFSIVLPIHVFRELSGDFFPVVIRFASQLHLVHHQGIEHPPFATNRQALGQNGRPSFVVRPKQFSACPKEVRKGRGRGIEFVDRLVLENPFRLSVGDQDFEGAEGNIKGSLS